MSNRFIPFMLTKQQFLCAGGCKSGDETEKLSVKHKRTGTAQPLALDAVQTKMERFMKKRFAALTVISCAAYVALLYVVFGCNGFVAAKEANNDEIVVFAYGLFRQQETHDEMSCQAWSYESIFKVIDDNVDNAVPLQNMQLGQTAAILGVVSATLYVILIASNVWFRIPNPFMRRLGGSFCIITMLLLGVMLPQAVSMPFCNVGSVSNGIIRCHVNQVLYYTTILCWLCSTIGVSFVGDTNVDRVLFRRKNEIEAVWEVPKYSVDHSLETPNEADHVLEEGTSAPTIDDILMLSSDEQEDNAAISEVKDGNLHNESLAACVRAAQSPGIDEVKTSIGGVDDHAFVATDDGLKDGII